MRRCKAAWPVPLSLIAALSAVRCGDLHGNSNPQILDSSLRGAAFSSSRVSRPGKPKYAPGMSLPREHSLLASCLSDFFMVKPHMQLKLSKVIPMLVSDDKVLPVLSFKGTAIQPSQTETFDKKSTFTQRRLLSYRLKSCDVTKQSALWFFKWRLC